MQWYSSPAYSILLSFGHQLKTPQGWGCSTSTSPKTAHPYITLGVSDVTSNNHHSLVSAPMMQLLATNPFH